MWKIIYVWVSKYLQPHELEPTRLLYPWNFPGKNTGVASHFLFQVSPQPRDWLKPLLLHILHWQTDSLPLASPGKFMHMYVCMYVDKTMAPHSSPLAHSRTLLTWLSSSSSSSMYVCMYVCLCIHIWITLLHIWN